MKMYNTISPILLLIVLLSSPLFAKKSTDELIKKAEQNLPTQCLFYFKMYLNSKEPKAFSYAIDSSDEVTCRFSAGSKTQKRANQVALESCEKSRKQKGIQSSCKLYKIDDTVSKTQKQLDFEKKYLLNLNQIRKQVESRPTKENIKPTKKEPKKEPKKKIEKKKPVKTIKDKLDILPKSCLMFYALYEEAKEHKAFSIAIDNDKKYVCKFSAGATSKERAIEVALASCEKTRKERHVKAPCQLFSKEKGTSKITIPAKKKEPLKQTAKHKEKTPPKSTPKIKPLKEVLEKKQAKDEKTQKLNRALQKAILKANLSKIKALIKKGADIDVEAKDKSRAIFVAVAKGDIAYTKTLLTKGAFVFVKKRDGNNLLVAAIMSGKTEMLKLMLQQGIDPNIRCEEGNTPLHFALMMFEDMMMKTLYKHKARDDIKNTKGQSVQDLAKELNLNLKRIKR